MWRVLTLLFLLTAAPAYAQTVEPWVTGTASSTDTAAHQLIAAPQLANQTLYVTGVQCGRNDVGTTPITVTFNDTQPIGNHTILVLPNNGGGGGNNATFISPITPGAATQFTFTVSSGTSTVTCNAQAFIR